MQAYGPTFARVYNKLWISFARQVAPQIFDFYASTPTGQTNMAVLDLCCGTGQLAVYFLERGYRVTGIDLSENMLRYARENAAQHLEAGRAQFIRADASSFVVDESFGLVVSTFDALNHLESFDALRSCFQSVFPVLVDEGYFIFDLNTRVGLMRWNNISVDESEEALVITRGFFDRQRGRSYTRVSGFVRTSDEYYERFEETVFNTVFDMQLVRGALLETGWSNVHFARVQELTTPLDNPEEMGRVFIVARK